MALEAHIGMTTRAPYKKRLKEHLKETRQHSRLLEKRIKKVNGKTAENLTKATSQANKLIATAKGPLHSIRGNSENEKKLKNAKTEYFNEHEEIATYTAIEALATELGDKDTAKMAKQIRRDEERMAGFLEKQIPILTRQMVKEEIPASERNAGSNGSSRKSAGKSGKSSRKKSTSSSRKSSGKSRAKSAA